MEARFTPSMNIKSVSAFRRGEPMSADSSCCTAATSACFSCTGSGHDLRLLFQLLRLIVRDQGVDHGLQLAVHEFRQLVRGVADAMVSDAVLRKVVGADLLAAVAGAHHGFTFLGQRCLLLLLLH